jgi:uncharacterized membrane protein
MTFLQTLYSGNPRLTFAERAVSVVFGLGLAAAGAKPRPNPLLNVLALGVGSYFAYRGATGRDPVMIALEGDRPAPAAAPRSRIT